MFKMKLRLVLISFLIGFGSKAQEVFKMNSSGGGFNVTVGYQGFGSTNYFQTGKDFDCGIATRTRYADKEKTVRVVKSTAEYREPSGGMLSTGFQGFGVASSFIIGGELNTLLGSSKSGIQIDSNYATASSPAYTSIGGTTSRFAGADVLLNIGFVALRKRGFILYPMIGAGYGASGLWLQSQSPSRTYPLLTKVVTDSDDNLQNMFIWTRNTVLDFGLGAQYMLGSSTEDRAKGFSLGLRFGYKMQLATNNILVNGNKRAKDSFKDPNSDPLPNLGYSGAYVKLLIGFGKVGESSN